MQWSVRANEVGSKRANGDVEWSMLGDNEDFNLTRKASGEIIVERLECDEDGNWEAVETITGQAARAWFSENYPNGLPYVTRPY